MTYISLADMDHLPIDDPERAFVIYEATVRERYNNDMNTQDNREALDCEHEYFSAVHPAIIELGIGGLEDWTKPNRTMDDETLYLYYEHFRRDVAYTISSLKLRIYKRDRPHSVALDVNARAKLRQQLNSLRDEIRKLQIPTDKRDALMRCIDALQDEIDSDRTNYRSYGRLVIEFFTNLGTAAKEAEPAVQAIERIGAALGVAKIAENSQAQLPPPITPKRLESPKRNKKQDDEIPF